MVLSDKQLETVKVLAKLDSGHLVTGYYKNMSKVIYAGNKGQYSSSPEIYLKDLNKLSKLYRILSENNDIDEGTQEQLEEYWRDCLKFGEVEFFADVLADAVKNTKEYKMERERNENQKI